MFTRKNTLISLAVVAFLAGCGGGGDGGTPAPSGTNSPASSTSNPPVSTAPTTDTKLASSIVLENNYMVFQSGSNNYIQIGYKDFNSNTPRDAATNYGAYGFAKGTNAPIQGIGYQVAVDAPPAADSRPGRVAFELQDQAGVTPQEVLRIEIDKITSAVDANGNLTVTVPADAKVYVYASSAAGKATVSAPASGSMVSVVDENGAKALMFNVDAAVSAAVNAATGANKTVMSSVKNFGSGMAKPFEVTLLFSNLNMKLTDGTALTGKAGNKGITVDGSGLPGVLGGGATGYVQVDEPAPAQ